MGAAGGVEGVRGALSLSRCNARTAIFFPSFFFFFSILTYRYRSNAVSTPLFQELRGAELRGRVRI